MDRTAEAVRNESRFSSDVEHLASTFAHADRCAPFASYEGAYSSRRARVRRADCSPASNFAGVQGAHQSMHYFVANADWLRGALPRQVRTLFLPAIEKSGGVKAWIGDDTGIAKWRSFRWRRPGVFRATRQVGPRQQYQ